MLNVCVLFSFAGPLTCFILVLLGRDKSLPEPKPHLEDVANVLEWVLRLMPTFCLGNGLFSLINLDVFLVLEDDASLTAWSGPILLYDIYQNKDESILK